VTHGLASSSANVFAGVSMRRWISSGANAKFG